MEEYSAFFSSVIKRSGLPPLSGQQWARMLNVVHLETKYRLLVQLRVGYRPHDKEYQRLSDYSAKVQTEMTNLTKYLKPDKLLQDMLWQSYSEDIQSVS